MIKEAYKQKRLFGAYSSWELEFFVIMAGNMTIDKHGSREVAENTTSWDKSTRKEN